MQNSETSSGCASTRDPRCGTSVLWSMLVFLVVVGSVLLAYFTQLPPAPKAANAPATEFSAVRALEHIKKFAVGPHGANSRANDKVRDYIFSVLKEMNIQAELQKGINADGMTGIYQNVLARIPGTANTKAFAMEAHYDSVPYGPGASDDGGGVGAMLEIARAIKAGPPLKNDVIFVFSDSEEINAGGARAFAEHPWAKDVGVLLNFEARGTSGPSYMFETSDENGWLIAEMAKAGVEPRATSVMFDVYKRSPFGSDLTALKRKGIKGFNVAFIDNFCFYHTREDRPERVNLASLQHHGTYGLGFARHFGNIPLDHVTAPDATYFNPIGSYLVYYPISLGRPLAEFAAALLAVVLILGFARRHLTFGGLIASLGAFLLCALCAALVTGILVGIVFKLYNRDLLYHNSLYGLALTLIATSVVTFLFGVFRRGIRLENLAAAALIWWLALLAALEWFVPGGAYLALWPLIFGSVGTGILFLGWPQAPALANRSDSSKPGYFLVLVTTLFGLPGIFLSVPSLVGFLAMGTILFCPLIAVVIVLLAGLLMPQLQLFESPNRAWLPALSGILGAGLLAVGLLTNGPSASRPHYDCLSYGLDLDAGKAYWLSSDKAPDEWVSQFIPLSTTRENVHEFIPRDDRKYLKAPAPMAPTTGPDIQVVKDEVVNGKRNLTFHVGSPEAVTEMTLSSVTDAEIFASTIFGKDTGPAQDHWTRRVQLFPREGVDVTLKVEPNQDVRIKAIEECYGLPEGVTISPRPAHLMTESNITFDQRPLRSERTFVCKTVEMKPKQ